MQASPDPITEALRLATVALRRFVEDRMNRVHGTRWQEVARAALRSPSPRGEFDLAALISIVVTNQRSVFEGQVGPRELTWVHELRGVRNQWAHQEPFAPEDIYRALDTIARVLKVADAPETATVSALAKEALARIQGPPPAPLTAIPARNVAAPPGSDDALAPPVRGVLRAPSANPKPAVAGHGEPVSSTPGGLLAQFVATFETGRPHLATYSWIFSRLFGYQPKPWSQGHGVKVISDARTATPLPLRGVGQVRLDTFIVGEKTRLPGPGYWRSAPCSGDEWTRAFAGAVLLHGDLTAPWEQGVPDSPPSPQRIVGTSPVAQPAVPSGGRTVFVLSQRGWVSHGPVRASETQAHHVADLLRKRLGWVAAVASHPPALPNPLPEGLPPIELATLSPVWRDPGLAELWNAHKRPKR